MHRGRLAPEIQVQRIVVGKKESNIDSSDLLYTHMQHNIFWTPIHSNNGDTKVLQDIVLGVPNHKGRLYH